MTRIDRRAFLGGASAALAVTSANAQTTRLLKTIPSSGEQVPAIGMGSWLTFDVAGDANAVRQRTDVLRAFFQLGGAVIDSSPMYGSSQTVIGEALDALDRPDHFSADKVWIDGGANGPPQIARSRQRWGVQKFDLLQVHNLRDWRPHLDTLFQMKADGALRYVGVTSYSGLRYGAIESIMETEPIDFIQVTYNLADREAEQRLLPIAEERGIAVIANRPFREGGLIRAVKQRPLPALATEIGAKTHAEYLLKFIISHPALTAAIPATRRVDHMRENMGALKGLMPDMKLRKQMIDAFEREF